MTNNTNTKNGPDMVALSEKEIGRNKSTLIKIGVAFSHKDGQGYNLQVEWNSDDLIGRIIGYAEP